MTLPWIDLSISRDTNGHLHVSASGFRDTRVVQQSMGITDKVLAAFTTAVQKRAEYDQALTDEHTAQARSLHEALFHPKIIERCAELQSIQDAALLVRLAFSHVDLQKVTWEALCKPTEALGFFGTSAKYLAIRTVADGRPWEFRPYAGPARIQAIAPTDTAALVNLQGALAPRIDSREIQWLLPICGEAAKARHLLNLLGQDPTPHILHFVGHGGVDSAGKPFLQMHQDGDDDNQRLSVELLAQELTGKNVSLVVLEACQGADPGAFASAAEMLARAGVGAVLAHLWPVRGNAGRTISVQFYQTLCAFNEGAGNVAAAANEARRVLLAENNNSARAFSTVLYMRGTDPKLFAFAQKRGGASGTGDDDVLAARVKRVIEYLSFALNKHEQLISLLASRLELTYPPGEGARTVASTLVQGRKAMDIAKMLNHLDAELLKGNASKEMRGALRTVLWQMLPLAIDWQALVRSGVATFTARRNAIELPLRSETIAEIVLAGIDDRCCRFDPPAEGHMPVGATVVRIPAMAQSALLDRDGSRLAQLIVKQLAAEMDLESHGARYPELREEVDAVLQYHAVEAPDDERLPYYLLFLEADLQGKEIEHDLWTLARSKLSEELPHLRLVRLTGGQAGQEIILAKHIDAICRRS